MTDEANTAKGVEIWWRSPNRRCLEHWLEQHINRPHLTQLDRELRDELAAKAHRNRIKSQLELQDGGQLV